MSDLFKKHIAGFLMRGLNVSLLCQTPGVIVAQMSWKKITNSAKIGKKFLIFCG